MASANILLVIINHLLYRFIARQASVVLVKVLILSCVFGLYAYHISATMEACTSSYNVRLIGSFC